ncbi:MAG: hypothetical protein KDA84_15365, partial [Planctomycetaceae bacterium]|nr:hypothetical protein [Planctomycetaceae bacterium]
ERMFNGRWMSVQREASQRSDFDNAWEVETEHFHVRTNVSLEMGVQISRRMEDFHNFFLREFTPFFNTPQQMQQLFTTGIRRSAPPRQFRVYYLSSKKEFVEMLQARQPNISMANGLYMPNDRIAYFYFDDRPDAMETLYHEVTHQLLGESLSKTVPVGENSDFWVIEGIACYMESLKRENGKMTLGDPMYDRFYWARNRYLRDNFYVPLAQFAAMGMREFQHQPGEKLLWSYSQSSGLVHFFMHAEGGAYRDALVTHLSEIYRPNRRIRPVPSLAELTGLSFQQLDQKYGQYIRNQQKALQNRQPLQPASE